MNKIVWDNSCSVGVESMDAQHKRIIGMINLLIEDPSATVRSETVSELLTRLTQYSIDHFKEEEKLLSDLSYPGLAEQKDDHKAYMEIVVGFCKDTIVHDSAVPEGLLSFIKDWWESHILVDDMKYRTFVADKGVK